MNVVTIGSAMYDTFLLCPETDLLHFKTTTLDQSFLVFEEGIKIEIDQIKHYSGVGATNSAVSFSRLGFDTNTVCVIGDDPAGSFIKQKLIQENISTKLIIETDRMQTGTSFIIPTSSGNRVILIHRGAHYILNENHIPYKEISQADLLYITSLGGPTAAHLPSIVTKSKDYEVLVACNPGTSQLTSGADIFAQSLPNIEIVILNCHEAKLLMSSLVQSDADLLCSVLKTDKNRCVTDAPPLLQRPIMHQAICFNLYAFFEAIHLRGPRIVVVTHGEDGVYVSTEHTILYHPSIDPDTIVNTVGAGDAFGSAFVAALMYKYRLEQAIQWGIVNAT